MTELLPPAHLDETILAALDPDERLRLLHVAICSTCRRLTVAELLKDEQQPAEPLADDDAATRRLRRALESTDLASKALAIEQERREATTLVRNLCAQPEAWSTAGADPRYGSPEVVWQLLEAAKQEESLMALRLINLAGEIAIQLTSRRPGTSLYLQLRVEVSCARAHNLLDMGNRREAARELRGARALLSPDLGYGRALYCRALGRLRADEKRWEEAVALLERTAALFDDHGDPTEVGQALIEQGWALIEAGDADEAVTVLAIGLRHAGMVPQFAVTGRLALAVAMAELREPSSAGKFLAEADSILLQVDDPILRLRLRWLAALASRRCGRRSAALRQLTTVLAAFLALGYDYEASRVLLEILTLCQESRWPRTLARRDLQRAIDKLSASPHLHRRLRAVIGFAAYATKPPTPLTSEVLGNATRYLLESRHLPELPFLPTGSGLLLFLDWDQLEPQVRRSICAEVGASSEIAEHPSRELSAALQDQISWRYEILRRARIVFHEFQEPEPPPA